MDQRPTSQRSKLYYYYLDRRIRDELQRTDEEDEHLHDVSVAAEHVEEGVLDLGLDLVPIEPGGSSQFDENERERDEGEDEGSLFVHGVTAEMVVSR